MAAIPRPPTQLLHVLALAASLGGAAHASDQDEVSLLQVTTRGVGGAQRSASARALVHHWSHSRGNVGSYSSTPYSMPANLSSALAWSWQPPEGPDGFLWNTLIDSERNVYVTAALGVYKFSPDGQLLWKNPVSSLAGTLLGDSFVGMHGTTLFRLSLATGVTEWERKVWRDRGANGDFVEAHDGIAVVAVEAPPGRVPSYGLASLRVLAVDVFNGDTLWDFKPDCGLWNMMALFPGDDTTVFMDVCGGLYRLGLHNGSLFWKSPGANFSFTDGGPILGPDGGIYACSNPAGQMGGSPTADGLVRKVQFDNGATLWETTVPYPCVNFPGVSHDGRLVVVAPGALAEEAKTKQARGLSRSQAEAFYQEQATLGGLQRSHYGMPNLPAAILGLDAGSGEVLWRHEMEPWGRVAFAGDEERALRWVTGRGYLPGCWPSHWSAPVISHDGTVYVGRSSGDFYAFHPERGISDFRTGDGHLMAGAAFAPRLMGFTSCSRLFVFKSP